MEQIDAVDAFAALAQETRLAVFRLLLKAEPEGIPAGEIAEILGVRQNTMSANLAVLLQSGLVRNVRQGRTVRYFVDVQHLQELLGFLMADCCGGDRKMIQPIIEAITPPCESVDS
jgi:DNA-binding transcriptional ArsR family regulator